jgi:hypothetical protein
MVDEEDTRQRTRRKKNSYKQNGMFLSRPHTICMIEILFKRTQGCTVDSGTITDEPANLRER